MVFLVTFLMLFPLHLKQALVIVLNQLTNINSKCNENLSKVYKSCSSSQARTEGGLSRMESRLVFSSLRHEIDPRETSSKRCENRLTPRFCLWKIINRINIMVSQSMMKQLGYPIDIASNGVWSHECTTMLKLRFSTNGKHPRLHLYLFSSVQKGFNILVLQDVCMPVYYY